ncbi:hypothetical protein Tco_0680774 [Tanacetum coccineum]|uniref:Uncharacterized protein n=1 Tax=Tanacetum coccineum TaxID=301880 RepID=A0ABQ4XLG1_9ASTR
MRIEQYFLQTDYSIWEVILNGNKVLKRKIREVEQEYEPTTTEEKQDRRNEMKDRGTLLMGLPNKDQLKFHSYKDAKLLMEAIEKRFQKLISQLKIQGETISQEDMNLKLLRSLPSEWKTHALIWRNKVEIETISLDDFTNSNNSTNKADNTAYGVSTAHTQSSPTSGDNLSDDVICAFLASQHNSPQISREDLEQIDLDDLEEMDLQWEMAMLTIRARRLIKRTGRLLRNHEKREKENNRRTVTVETPNENALVAQDRIGGYDWSYQAEEENPTNFALMAHTSSGSSSSSDSEVDSCFKSCVKAYATLKEQYDNLNFDYNKSQFNLVSYKAELESVEARLAHHKKNEAVFEESINVLKLEVRLRDNALVENKRKLEKEEKERDELKITLEKFQNSSKSLNNLLESQVSDKFKTGLGYNAATAASPTIESFVNSSKMLENQEYNSCEEQVVSDLFLDNVVDVHLYRSMIGSLMYLTAFRPDIIFVVCACARFQVTPKTSHLHAVKRIFRYLKGQSKLGLWYPRDSPFDLEAFLDSDYAGDSLDRKSTTRGCQFLGKRLISWQCKKQTIVANSTTEAEYVAVANCCGQAL